LYILYIKQFHNFYTYFWYILLYLFRIKMESKPIKKSPYKTERTINLDDLNKNGLLNHLFQQCLPNNMKHLSLSNKNTQETKLRSICIYLNTMKQDLVWQNFVLQECFKKALETIRRGAFDTDRQYIAFVRDKCNEWTNDLEKDIIPLSQEYQFINQIDEDIKKDEDDSP